MGVANRKMIPERDREPCEESRVRRDPKGAVALLQRGGKVLRGLERGRAGQGIGPIDRLDLDERGLAIVAPRHGAHDRDAGQAPLRGQEIALGRVQFALDQIK